MMNFGISGLVTSFYPYAVLHSTINHCPKFTFAICMEIEPVLRSKLRCEENILSTMSMI